MPSFMHLAPLMPHNWSWNDVDRQSTLIAVWTHRLLKLSYLVLVLFEAPIAPHHLRKMKIHLAICSRFTHAARSKPVCAWASRSFRSVLPPQIFSLVVFHFLAQNNTTRSSASKPYENCIRRHWAVVNSSLDEVYTVINLDNVSKYVLILPTVISSSGLPHHNSAYSKEYS